MFASNLTWHCTGGSRHVGFRDPLRDRRRQRGRGPRRLRAERSHRHLPDHAVVEHGRVGGPVGGREAQEPLGHDSLGRGDAERRRRGRRAARRAADRLPGDDVHRIARPPADDSEHVQNRRRADARGLPHRRAHAGHARAVDLRRPQRRHGLPLRRLGDALLGERAGGAGLRVHRPGGDARGAHPVPALLRRLPHLARDREDRRVVRGADAGDDRPRARLRPSCARPHARPPRRARHGAEPRRLLPGPRAREPVLRRVREHRGRVDGALRARHRPPLRAVRVPRRARRRARHRADGLRLRGRARDGRRADRARREDVGPAGEPLFLDVVNALYDSPLRPRVVGGRYGLSSKEFTPAMVKGVFDYVGVIQSRADGEGSPAGRGSLAPLGMTHFTVGITDDVTHLSIPYDLAFTTESDDVVRAMFYGLGSDGTVSANKNSCKIIGDRRFVQGYFVYDSKKAGTVTVSHLRFGPRPIRSTYLVDRANFIACHQPQFIERIDMVKDLALGGTFLLNAPADVKFPPHFLRAIEERGAKLYVIDATKVARECGLGNRISTIMQVAFVATTNVLPIEGALDAVRDAVRKTFKRKGQKVVDQNLRTIDATLENLKQVLVSDAPATPPKHSVLSPQSSLLVREIIAGRGDQLPVSALPCDGTFPSGTTQYEKRNLANEIPVWDVSGCIQCGKCAMVCPHAAIRIKAYDEAIRSTAPSTFKTLQPIHKDWKGLGYTIQVAPEDCTGCAICVDVCPATSKVEPARKSLYMAPQPPLRDEESKNWDFFLGIPEFDRAKIQPGLIRSVQL